MLPRRHDLVLTGSMNDTRVRHVAGAERDCWTAQGAVGEAGSTLFSYPEADSATEHAGKGGRLRDSLQGKRVRFY